MDDLALLKRVNELFKYDSETGSLIRIKSVRGGKANIGDVAGYRDTNNGLSVCIDFKVYRVHRIIWLMHYGYLPTKDIKHLDGDTFNNRLENLVLSCKDSRKLTSRISHVGSMIQAVLLANPIPDNYKKSNYEGVRRHDPYVERRSSLFRIAINAISD